MADVMVKGRKRMRVLRGTQSI